MTARTHHDAFIIYAVILANLGDDGGSDTVRIRQIVLALLAFVAVTPSVRAQDWTNWRGPYFNGSADATGLPVKFSRTQGVKWAADLPGPSAGTPVIYRDYVFISSTDLKAQELVALCFNRVNGKLR